MSNMSLSQEGFQEYLVWKGTFQFPAIKVSKFDPGNLPWVDVEKNLLDMEINSTYPVDKEDWTQEME